MTVWIFGDSFSQDHSVDYQWFRQLSRITDTEVLVTGQGGWSNDYISYCVHEYISSGQIKPNDFVIQIQTQYSRSWLFEDRPHLSNFAHHSDPTRIGMTKDEHAATQSYIRHLYNSKSLVWQTFANSWALVGLTSQINCRCLTLPAFWNLQEPYNPHIGVRGTLTEWVSYLELDTVEEYDRMLATPSGDPRPNHMNQHNHGVLAHKLAHAIFEGGDLDLTQGFKIRQPREQDFINTQAFNEWQNENTD